MTLVSGVIQLHDSLLNANVCVSEFHSLTIQVNGWEWRRFFDEVRLTFGVKGVLECDAMRNAPPLFLGQEGGRRLGNILGHVIAAIFHNATQGLRLLLNLIGILQDEDYRLFPP